MREHPWIAKHPEDFTKEYLDASFEETLIDKKGRPVSPILPPRRFVSAKDYPHLPVKMYKDDNR